MASKSKRLHSVATTLSVAVYLRVSSEEQRERQTINTQREFAEKYCDLHEIVIAGWYADDGVSGTIPLDERPAGARLLADAAAGQFSRVLVYRLDRLGRDPRHILNAVAELDGLAVTVKSMTEEFDTSSPAGRLLLTMLAGIAGFERDSIIQRSTDGTNRLAHAGAWLGGIVPYGYRVVGKHRDARLVPADDPIPGLPWSEADVVRLIYTMSADDGASCITIAERLNTLAIPPAYVRDGRLVVRGKRNQAVAGVWTASRIRNLLVNTTYRGVHQYGKRSTRERSIIERAVPALVDDALWARAQQTLRKNLLFSPRSARHRYLLRGLIKCAFCGSTFVGVAYHSGRQPVVRYYRCNGRHNRQRRPGRDACTARAVPAELLEQQIWADVAGFLRDPQAVLPRVAARYAQQSTVTEHARADAEMLRGQLAAKTAEKDTVIGLFRRGRIDADALDRQLDGITAEERQLATELAAMLADASRSEQVRADLQGIEVLLTSARVRLDAAGQVTWDAQREYVERFVRDIVLTAPSGPDAPTPTAVVTYWFDNGQPTITATRTDIRAASSYGWDQQYALVAHGRPVECDTFGGVVRAARHRLRLTQRALAQAAGINEQTICRWESYPTVPRRNAGKVARVCALLGLEAATLRAQYPYRGCLAWGRQAARADGGT